MAYDEVLKQVISRAGVVKVRNAMNPTLWACAIVPLICWVAATVLKDTVAFLPLVVVGMVPVVTWFLQTVYFSLSDPSRLQSEEYQLRHQALNMIERKGSNALTDPDNILDLTEPEFERLQEREGGHA